MLVQAVLSPIVGRLSDVLGRKVFAAIPPLIACAGSVVCAKADSMAELVGGGVLLGTTLATRAVVQSILAEILPLKHRIWANAYASAAGSAGGL